MPKRIKPRLTTSPTQQAQLHWNEAAYAGRDMKVGPVYDLIGAVGTARRVGFFAALRVVNTAATAAYVKIGGASVTAPTGIADGHYVSANSELLISTGEQGDYIIASAATVGVYKVKDSIVVEDETGSTQV